MRNKLISSLAGAAFSFAASGLAFAADMAVKALPPPPAPVYNWTGFYIGGNAGYGWENTIDNSVTSVNCFLAPGTCTFGPTGVVNSLPAAVPGRLDTHPKGFIGGGQIGYNYQFAPNWLAGLETDFQGADIKGDETITNTGACCGSSLGNLITVTGTGSQKIDWFGTLRGRVGWLPINPLLVYATGGLAYGHVRTDVSFAGAIIAASLIPGATALSQSDIHTGWTVGGGLEWMFAPQWSVKAEYLYYDLGTVTLNQTLALTLGGVVQASATIQSDAHYHGNIVRGGLNYHF